jgi:L,D-peptidoglycan transpeptidase YkuD (ErfK/YbiS/YcfS/YnhG family)
MARLVLVAGGTAWWGARPMRCALGRAGIVDEKREGDGGSPAGLWPMREVLFRGDRLGTVTTALPARPIEPEDGWCDDPADPCYNRKVRLPYPGRCERLWRADRLYDIVVPLGYNDDPVVPGAGSAIFLHVARRHFPPTEGCVALALGDLLAVLAAAQPGAAVRIIAGPGFAPGQAAGRPTSRALSSHKLRARPASSAAGSGGANAFLTT